MARVMFDSVTVADLPASATMIGVYVDGPYANEDAARARFPAAQLVRITTRALAGAHVIDCESGDATPAQAAAWAVSEHARGRHPTIYTSSSQWPTVKAAVSAQGLPAGAVSYWIAHYDGDPTIPSGAVAKQYHGGSTPGQHYDTSSVGPFWPGVDPTPQEDDVPLTNDDAALVATAVWNRFLIHGPHGDVSLSAALAQLLTASDPAAFAAALAPHLPGIDQATIEAGVRAVFADAAQATP